MIRLEKTEPFGCIIFSAQRPERRNATKGFGQLNGGCSNLLFSYYWSLSPSL